METVSAKFIEMIPRHRRALEMLVAQKKRDSFGGIGVGALRDEDEPFTLEEIVQPLWERGLVEDLTQTELGSGGKYFVRITRLGEVCLGLGYMLRERRKATQDELQQLAGAQPAPPQLPAMDSVAEIAKRLGAFDANEEQEAIA
jgi:hypothetical protein